MIKGRFSLYLRKGKSSAVCECTQYIYSIHFVLVGFHICFWRKAKAVIGPCKGAEIKIYDGLNGSVFVSIPFHTSEL